MSLISKRNKKRVAGALLALSLVTGSFPGLLASNTAEAADGSFELRVLHTNDTHAHLDNMPRRITAINQVKTDNTLLLDAGDVFSGTLYFNQHKGLADLWFMNYVGYDAMTFGNHEFDTGPAGLEPFVEGAEFPFVSANIDFSDEAALSDLFVDSIGEPGDAAKIYPAIIKEVNGEKIGIIGLTTPESSALSSPGENLTFKDEAESAKETIDLLEEKGVNKIIVVSHLGYTVDQELAAEVEGIDIIVGGHSHTKLSSPYVYQKDSESAPTVIVQTGEYGVNLGQLDAVFNDSGVLTKWDGQLINVDAKLEDGTYVYADDAAAAAKLAEYAAPLDTLKKTIISKSDVLLDGVRDNVRTKETNLGDLIADGMLSKVSSLVDEPEAAGYITIQNAGGIRDSIPAGDITLGQLLTVMPFGNNLSALYMTGEEVVAALENGVSGVAEIQGRFPQVAGMRFYYDSTKPGEIFDPITSQVTQEGQRIVSVDILQEDGTYAPIDPDAYYVVATNSYMANGGDFYRSMKAARDDGRFYELNLVDYEVFNEYLDLVGTVDYATEGRITDLLGATLVELNDIDGHWAADSIVTAVESGIVTGYADGTFRPNASATRAEFISLVSRAFQLGESASSVAFHDTSSIPAWAAPHVAVSVEKGIIGGYTDNTFRPSSAVTRAEMTAIIVRALGLETDANATLSFSDASKVPAWAVPAIAAAAEAGLVNGKNGNKFAPNDNATRAEVVTLLLKALEYSAD